MKAVTLRRSKLLAAATAMLFAGVIYAWSVLRVPLAEEFGWSNSALAFNYTLTLCAFCLGGIAGGRISMRFSPQAGLRIGAAMIALGFFFVSRLDERIIFLYLSYAGLTGIGIGISYNILISTTNAWFPDKKGFCSGVMMMCFGFSSLVFGKVADTLFQLEAVGWRKTFLLFGILIAAVLILCSRWMRLPEEGTVFPEEPGRKGKTEESFEVVDMTTAQMAHRSSFWKFFVFAVLTSAVGNSVIGFARDLALSVGAYAGLATTLVGVLSLCNGLGRIICGLSFDRLGRRKTMLISNGITLLAAVFVLVSLYYGSLVLCICGLCLTGIGYGFLATIISTFTLAFYGGRYFPSNYSLSNMFLLPASFGATLTGVLLSRTGGFELPMILLIVFASVALCINYSIRRP